MRHAAQRFDDAESSGMRPRVGAADHIELVDDRSDAKLGRMDRNRAPPRGRFVRRALAEQHQRRPATGPSETTDAQGFTSGSSIRKSISPPRSERHGPPSRDTTPSAPSPGRSPEWRVADRMNRVVGFALRGLCAASDAFAQRLPVPHDKLPNSLLPRRFPELGSSIGEAMQPLLTY
jgi:hypothetical protein